MNSDKLNDIIKKKSNGNNNLAHHLHQMFFFEHVLMRLEKSKLEYTKKVNFDDTIKAINLIIDILDSELVETIK